MFYRMRNRRNDECHYIKDKEDTNIVDYKIHILKDKMNIFTEQDIKKFEIKYECIGMFTYITSVLQSITLKNIVLSSNDIENIDNWWEV